MMGVTKDIIHTVLNPFLLTYLKVIGIATNALIRQLESNIAWYAVIKAEKILFLALLVPEHTTPIVYHLNFQR